MDKIIDRRNAEYNPLIEKFKNEIKGLNVKGLTGPHFPCVGECYEKAKYKFAFCGMETYGWTSLQDLMDTKNASDYLEMGDSNLNNLDPIDWISNNLHTTFWGFIFKFLAKFYNYTDVHQLIDEEDETSNSILKSFVWGNSNSIEDFETTSKVNGADPNVWDKVKKASKKFDNLNHIINFGHPDVIFILWKGYDENLIANDDALSQIYSNVKQKNNILKIQHKNPQYTYYYLRNSSTHVFLLYHPRWIGQYSGIGFEKYIDSLLEDIKNYNIWDELPKTSIDWEIVEQEKSVDSIDLKYKLIASIAHSLVQNNSVMCGSDIGSIFNINGIETSYGTPYSEDRDRGRGVFSVISKAWSFYSEKGDYQTAYEIARSFVKKDGEYAYD